jgi:YD repeat-containing protein
VEHIAGVEVGRSYRSTFNRFSPSGGYTYEETQQITCTVPGAARNNPSNRIYISRVIDDPDHPFHGKPVLNLSSEGTGTIYDYRIAGNRQLTTIYSGTVEQRTAGGQFVVVDGTRTQTQTDLDGRLLSSRTYDIQSGLLTASIDHIAFDRHGRLLETYNNLTGRSSSTTYACCGVETSTDETGSLTAYTYDSLKRQNTITRHGLTTEYVYDAMGRVIETRRHGTDGSVVTLSKNEYDAVGNLRDSYQRSTETTDNGHALFHKTAHQDTTAPDGSLISTTHYPDGSKRIETHYLDGSLKSVSGSAVAPEYYEYGITDAGEQYTTVYSGTSNQAALWTKSYTNFKGEHYKTVQSSGAQELSFYDENGRVTKLQHADGEITLYDYNSKGQREITCIDMNRNGLIDYDGSDRITRTLFEYGQRSDGTVVRRTRQLVWSEHGKGVETQQLRSETTLDGLKSWNYTFGIVARSVTEIDHKTNTLTSRSYATDHSYTETIQQNGRTLSVTSYDSKGHRLTQKTYTYDPHGRTATVTDLFSGTTTYSYYDNGQIKTLTTPVPEAGKAAQTTTYTYDEMGRQKTLTTPDGTVKHYNYYLTGQLKNSYSTGSGQSGHYPVSYTYDDAGRQKNLTTYKNHTVDSTGTLTGTIAEVTTWHYYDTSGLLKRKTRGDGSAADKGTDYTYTPGGKVKTRTWARGSVTTFDYLTDGRLPLSYTHQTLPTKRIV